MSQNTDHDYLVNLQYALATNLKLFSFIRKLASKLTSAPGGERSVDTLRSEDRNNPGISGNAEADYNVFIDCAAFFYEKKGTGDKNYQPSDVALTGKIEGKEAHLVSLY